MRMLTRLWPTVAVVGVLVLGACGDGEDRPGEVTTESGSGTGTGSASGAGSASGTGSASGAGEHDTHGDSAEAAFTEAEANSEAVVTMTDYAFAMPATVKGTKVFFEVTNDGASEHEFLVVNEAGEELGEIEPFRKADGKKTLALELEPGSYKAVCLVKEGVKTHLSLGMQASFTVE